MTEFERAVAIAKLAMHPVRDALPVSTSPEVLAGYSHGIISCVVALICGARGLSHEQIMPVLDDMARETCEALYQSVDRAWMHRN